MNQNFMKEKPVLPLVISMALPMTLSMLVNALYNIVDSYFVAKISSDAMTALSLVYPIQNVVTSVAVGFGVGINAAIAFFLGAGKQELADKSASLGLLYNFFHGILLTILCITLMPRFLSLFTSDEAILQNGITYSNLVFAFSIPIMISISFEKIYQAVGRMKVSMLCMIIGCVTNILLDPVLIFGMGKIPAMGIKGAAIATDMGQLATLCGYLVFYFYPYFRARFLRKTSPAQVSADADSVCEKSNNILPLPVTISRKYMGFDKAVCKRLYAVGIPATLNMALPSLQISALNGILSTFSSNHVLVLGAYYKLQTFLYLTANGVVQGMRPIIGYNYGAGEHKRVRKIFTTALSIILVVMALGTVLCLSIPQALIGIFTDNAATIQIGCTALRIISIGFLVSSLSVTVCGALEGLGKGTQSLIITSMRYIVIMLPAAFLLSRLFGAVGVWHGFWVTEFLTAGGCTLYLLCKRNLF